MGLELPRQARRWPYRLFWAGCIVPVLWGVSERHCMSCISGRYRDFVLRILGSTFFASFRFVTLGFREPFCDYYILFGRIFQDILLFVYRQRFKKTDSQLGRCILIGRRTVGCRVLMERRPESRVVLLRRGRRQRAVGLRRRWRSRRTKHGRDP